MICPCTLTAVSPHRYILHKEREVERPYGVAMQCVPSSMTMRVPMVSSALLHSDDGVEDVCIECSAGGLKPPPTSESLFNMEPSWPHGQHRDWDGVWYACVTSANWFLYLLCGHARSCRFICCLPLRHVIRTWQDFSKQFVWAGEKGKLFPPPKCFTVCQVFFWLLVDLFATLWNKLLTFVLPVLDPSAWVVDTLSIPWHGLRAYALFWQYCLPKVLEKVKKGVNVDPQVALINWRHSWSLDLVALSMIIPWKWPLSHVTETATQPDLPSSTRASLPSPLRIIRRWVTSRKFSCETVAWIAGARRPSVVAVYEDQRYFFCFLSCKGWSPLRYHQLLWWILLLALQCVYWGISAHPNRRL